jgi:uncharacterized protein YneF (UPF0154 family)
MQESKEPSNLKWENWDKTVKDQLKRKIAVFIAIAVLLIGAFFAFYIMKIQTIANYKKYPPTTDCKSIVQMFNGNF